MAPLEGITGYIYRNTLDRYFPGADRYYTPFIVPDQNHPLRSKELRDILPENNQVKQLIPQIMTNDAQRFKEAADALLEYGYQEVNLNLGCPSGTVTARKKGAGFLSVPDELDRFLDRIFSENKVRISIKTRIGMSQPEEAFRLMEIYNQYPMSELIIHPRTREEFYRGMPHLLLYGELFAMSRMPICYNGNLLTKQDYELFRSRFPETQYVMLGRGALADPGLIGRLAAQEADRTTGSDVKNAPSAVTGRGLEAEGTTGSDVKSAPSAMTGRGQEAEGMTGSGAKNAPSAVTGSGLEAEGMTESSAKSEAASPVLELDDPRYRKQLHAFHNDLFAQYREIFGEERNAVFHMKELWGYMFKNFEDCEKIAKKIRKATKATEYLCEVDRLFRECEIRKTGPLERGLVESQMDQNECC